MPLLRFFDVALVVVAAPIMLLIGVPAAGYLIGAGAWIALRAVGVAAGGAPSGPGTTVRRGWRGADGFLGLGGRGDVDEVRDPPFELAVEGTSVEDGVVTVELVYDGSEYETRQLLVSEQGGDLVIADDLGPV